MDELRREVLRGLDVEAPIALFERYVECIAETFAAVVTKLGQEVEDAEDEVLAGRFEDQGAARLLQEEIGRRLNEATSRNLYLLSMLTTTLLPITLVTGIFGMNLGGIPWADHPHGFAFVTLGILTGVAVGLFLLWRRRVF